MRMGNGYQLCTGGNNTCRYPFGRCPIPEHTPILSGEQGRRVIAELGYPGVVRDATCRECGFIVHAVGCPALMPEPKAEPVPQRPTFAYEGPPCPTCGFAAYGEEGETAAWLEKQKQERAAFVGAAGHTGPSCPQGVPGFVGTTGRSAPPREWCPDAPGVATHSRAQGRSLVGKVYPASQAPFMGFIVLDGKTVRTEFFYAGSAARHAVESWMDALEQGHAIY